MVRELCKWDYELRNGEQLEAVIDRAIEIATSEPCGPVYLSLPREVMSAQMTSFTFTAKPRRAYGTVPGPTPDQIARAADILAKAERPLIFARENARVAGNAHGARRVRRALRHPARRVPLARQFAADRSSDAGSASIPAPHLQGGRRDPRHRDRRAVDPDRAWRAGRGLQGHPYRRRSAVLAPADPQLPVRRRGDRRAARMCCRSSPRRSAAASATSAIAARRKQRSRRRASAARAAAAKRSSRKRRARWRRSIPPGRRHCIAQAKDDDAILVNEYSLILRHAPLPASRAPISARRRRAGSAGASARRSARSSPRPTGW